VLQRRSRSRRRRKPPARSDSRGSLRSARSTRERLRCLSRRGSPSALAPFSPTPATAQQPRPHSDRYNTATRRARYSRTDCDFPPLPHPRTAQRPPQHRTATGVSSCRADVRFAHSRRTARTRAVLHPHDPTRFEHPHRPHSRGGIPGDSPTTRARTRAPAHPGQSASRGARAKLSLTARLPVPRAALSAGRFAELRRSTGPTLLQSSSCARPDPHPVVGVRIGPVTTRSLRTALARVRGSVASIHGPARRLEPPCGRLAAVLGLFTTDGCDALAKTPSPARFRNATHRSASGVRSPLRGFPRRCRALPGAAGVAPG
jgi:hypothetical protein